MELNKSDIVLLNNTHPNLTGNLKFIFDANKDFWLQGIPANQEMYYSILQSYKLPLTYDYATILHSIFLKTPDFIKSKLTEENTEFSDHFKSGPGYNLDKNYEGVVKYSAPLYLRQNQFPDYFVVFQLPHFLYSNQTSVDLPTLFLNINQYKIIYSVGLKESNIWKFFNNSISKIPNNIHTADPETDYGMYIHGISPFQGHFVKKYINVDSYSSITYSDVLAAFNRYNLISSNIFNIDYLFNYSGPINPTTLYGLYFYKEEIEKLNIDIDKHNKIFQFRIKENNYGDLLRDEYLINDTPISVYVKDFQQPGDTFFGLIPYDYVGATGMTGSTGPMFMYLPPDDPISSPTGAPIGPTGTPGPAGINYLYAIGDKYTTLHNIKLYDFNDRNQEQKFTLTDDELYFTDLIGIQLENGKNINGHLLDTFGYSNLRLTLERNRNSQLLFESGDFFYIKPGLNGDYREWRVIANTDTCCDSRGWCYHDGKEYKFMTRDFTIYWVDNTMQLTFYYNKFIDVEEGNTIKITFGDSENSEVEFVIDKVVYLDNYNVTGITIIDEYGTYINTNNVEYIVAKYKDKSYKYSYFDPRGDRETVALNITKAFMSFDDLLFYPTNITNNIVFKAKYPKNNFAIFVFGYNFAQSNTPSNNILLNNKYAVGTDIKDSSGNVLFNRSRGETDFYGYTITKKTRFYINKDIEITGDEIIRTVEGRKKLKEFYIEGASVYHTNFLEQPNFIDDKIIDYTNLDNFLIYHIDDKNDDILLTKNGKINISYEFKPLLLKMSVINNSNL